MLEREIKLDDVMPLIKEKLASGQEVIFSPHGTSMLPFLKEGRDSITLKAPPARLKKYDIPLYQRKNGQYILHRVVDVMEKDGLAHAGIYNGEIGKGLVIGYDKSTLPCFTQWKMMGKQDYVLGLEPGNCHPDGRDVMRQQGKLQFIDPGETVTFEIKLTMIDGDDAWAEAKK